MALIRKTGVGSDFCNWARTGRELTRRYFDSPVAYVLPDTTSVASAKNTSEVHWVDPDHIGNPLYRQVVRKRLVEQFDCLDEP